MYQVISSYDQLDSVLDVLKFCEYVAYDTETTGLNTRKDRIIGFSFSTSIGNGYYLPLYRWDGKELVRVFNDHDALNILNVINTKKILMFNAGFDIKITKSNFGIDFTDALWCDVMLLKHTCDEDRPFALKEIATKLADKLGLDNAKEEQDALIESIKANGGMATKESYELYKADMNIIGLYAAKDTDLTFRIYEYYSVILNAEGLYNFFYKDEVMPLLKYVTIPMEEGGVNLDLNKLNDAKVSIETDISALEDEIQECIKPHLDIFTKWFLSKEMPPRRTGEFAQYLCKYGNLNLPKTKSGRYSIGKDHLDKHETNSYIEFLKGGDYLPSEVVFDVQKLWWSDQGIKYMFNISSKFHLAKLFFDTLNEQSITKTEKGSPQMNELFLDSVKDKYHFAKLIVYYNKLNKIKSTYIDRFLDSQEDGIFYPQFMQHRTISGRYGGDLQQLNRPMEYEPEDRWGKSVFKFNNMIREFFISGDGYSFIDSDYESLEPHVFAHVSGDDGLKNIFRNGHDFYSTIAIATEGLKGVSADKKADNYLGKLNKQLRQKSKSYSLGVPYGLGDYALSKQLDIGQKEAAALIEQYLNAFPKLKEWMDKSADLCVTKGLIKTEAGRARHMYKAPKIWYAHKEYILDSLKLWKMFSDKKSKYEQMKFLRKEMVNYINNSRNFQIQSLAASITNRACINIAKEIKRLGIDARIVAQIHDQIIVRVNDKHLDFAKTVQYLMENSYKISIKLKAPYAIAKNFKDGH